MIPAVLGVTEHRPSQGRVRKHAPRDAKHRGVRPILLPRLRASGREEEFVGLNHSQYHDDMIFMCIHIYIYRYVCIYKHGRICSDMCIYICMYVFLGTYIAILM